MAHVKLRIKVMPARAEQSSNDKPQWVPVFIKDKEGRDRNSRNNFIAPPSHQQPHQLPLIIYFLFPTGSRKVRLHSGHTGIRHTATFCMRPWLTSLIRCNMYDIMFVGNRVTPRIVRQWNEPTYIITDTLLSNLSLTEVRCRKESNEPERLEGPGSKGGKNYKTETGDKKRKDRK